VDEPTSSIRRAPQRGSGAETSPPSARRRPWKIAAPALQQDAVLL
jgi:hypothetical protein